MAQTLSRVRVVTLATNLPGPVAADRLRRMGAEVITVEPPTGDPLAEICPDWYAELTAGQQVTVCDLKTREGRAELDRLLDTADVLITAMRPAAAGRLGLPASVRERPRLSWIRIVGYAGERADTPGHDLTYQAVHGTLTAPTMPTVPVADLLGAERAVTAVLAALRERDRGGRGVQTEIVLDQAAADAGAAVRHGLTGPGAPLGGARAEYRIYRCADGHIALAVLEPHFRDRVCAALGVPATAADFAAAFAGGTAASWQDWARTHDIPLAAVTPAAEL